jgi:hypothetical protein
MPNHVHLIAVPSSADGLRWAIGSAHERYTRRINFREKWRGYLWQGRERLVRAGRTPPAESFLDRMEAMVGRVLKPQKRGPKRKQRGN